jgi:3-hydroxyisobutyrate dehydrogenase
MAMADARPAAGQRPAAGERPVALPGSVVGFVGLGNMGLPMAKRLARAGYRVQGYDLSPLAADGLRDEPGAAVVGSAAEVAREAGVVILMLPGSPSVEAVLLEQGLLAALSPRTLLVDMSSSEPARTRALAERAGECRVTLLDAPVSGGVRGAVQGALTIMVGGPSEACDAIEPLLRSLGSRVVRCGEAGSGHAVKALNNLMSAAHLLASSEAIQIGQAFGLDPQVILDVVNGSSGRSGSTMTKWPDFILTGSYDSGFRLRLMVKDMRIALGLAESAGVSARLNSAALELWSQAEQALPEDADHTEIARWLEATGKRWLAGSQRSGVRGDDHVRGLDHRDDLAALGKAELLDGLHGDRGHQANAGCVHFHVGDGLPVVDADDSGWYLVPRAQRHG